MRITLRCGKGKVSYKKLTCRSCNEFLREKIMKKKMKNIIYSVQLRQKNCDYD